MQDHLDSLNFSIQIITAARARDRQIKDLIASAKTQVSSRQQQQSSDDQQPDTPPAVTASSATSSSSVTPEQSVMPSQSPSPGPTVFRYCVTPQNRIMPYQRLSVPSHRSPAAATCSPVRPAEPMATSSCVESTFLTR